MRAIINVQHTTTALGKWTDGLPGMPDGKENNKNENENQVPHGSRGKNT